MAPERLQALPTTISKAMEKWSLLGSYVFEPCAFCNEVRRFQALFIDNFRCEVCLCDPDLCNKHANVGLISKYKVVPGLAAAGDLPEVQVEIFTTLLAMKAEAEACLKNWESAPPGGFKRD